MIGKVYSDTNVTLIIDAMSVDDGVVGALDIQFDGGIKFTATGTSGTGTESVTFRIDIVDAVGGGQIRFDSLTLTNTTDDLTGAAPTYEDGTIDGRIYVSDPSIGTGVDGYVDISTTTPFHKVMPDLYPMSGGPLVVTGANGSSVRLTPENNTTVMVEVDADGDGTYETTTTGVPWSSL